MSPISLKQSSVALTFFTDTFSQLCTRNFKRNFKRDFKLFTILFKIITRIKLLFSNYLGDYSYSFQGSFELINITVTVSLLLLQNPVTENNSPLGFPRIFCNCSYMPLGPRLLHYITLLFQSSFPDYVIFLYITELVSKYFLGYVISGVVGKHTMWTSDYIA